jgi:hypothetical protein
MKLTLTSLHPESFGLVYLERSRKAQDKLRRRVSSGNEGSVVEGINSRTEVILFSDS